MIKRYQTEEMARIWEERRKFDLWLMVELAVLEARAKLGQLDPAVAARIKNQAKFNVDRIEEIEKQTRHDLLAFVQAVQENLQSEDRPEFHWGMTSYDTEEIPTSLRLRYSLDVLLQAIGELEAVIRQKALVYKQTLMIGRTHGQQAEPITFGFKMLGWLAAFRRDVTRLLAAKQVIAVGKISGAVGTYCDLSPEIEKAVCDSLGLQPADHATQILHRDRIAQVMGALAILAGNIEQVAQDFRLMAQTEIGEVREPFGKGQKGSSKMPHKKNTIMTEQLCGMARLIRSYNQAALEEIQTWSERDISQSSVERIILPDAFHLSHYMVQKLTWLLREMEVNAESMQRNLRLTQGCIYSGRVKDLLLSWGLEAEFVYLLVQRLSFKAMEVGQSLLSLLGECAAVKPLIEDAAKQQALQECFDPWQGLQHLDAVFARFFQ